MSVTLPVSFAFGPVDVVYPSAGDLIESFGVSDGGAS